MRALVKLYQDNAATLTPDPLHSAFYDSHPPAAMRIARLQACTRRRHGSLAKRKCKPCEGGVPPYSAQQAQRDADAAEGLAASRTASSSKVYPFSNYHHTMAFVNALAWISHREDHHPDLAVGYNQCRVEYSTHAIGGLSENDFICAAKCDALFDLVKQRVFSSFDLLAAHHAKNLLEAEGIRAEVKNECLSSAMGELPPAECQAEVWVLNEGDAERAERLLRDGAPRPGRPGPAPHCGERSSRSSRSAGAAARSGSCR